MLDGMLVVCNTSFHSSPPQKRTPQRRRRQSARLQRMEGLPKPTRSSFKRSTMNSRSPLRTTSSNSNQRAGVPKPPSQDIPRKIKHFFYSLVGKRIKKVRRAKQEEETGTPLQELDVKKLIRLYCKHENLYNPKHSYYGNKEFAEDCYNDMARSIPGRSGYELRSCIEELRYLFEREHKIIESARQGKGEVPAPTIRYYYEFLFLVPYLHMDSNESKAESGTSSQKPKQAKRPPVLPSNKQLAQFTGFPLAAFPGKICCSPKEMIRRTFKKDGKKQPKGNKQMSDQEKQASGVTFSPSSILGEKSLSDNQGSKVSLTSSLYGDEQDLKTTDLTCPYRLENSPCVSECRLGNSGCRTLDSKPNTTSKPQASVKSVVESINPAVQQTYVKSNTKNFSEPSQRENSSPGFPPFDEQDLKTANATLARQKEQESVNLDAQSFVAEEQKKFMLAHPPNSAAVEKEKSIKSKDSKDSKSKDALESEVEDSPPDKKPAACPCSLSKDRKEAAPEDKTDNPSVAKFQNFKQVQMLCDMIRTELTAAPDFIYFDAKWRIIEILREVHKRQLVHMKAGPQRNAVKQQLDQLKMQHHPYKPNKNSPTPPVKPGPSKICDHIRGSHCPYCCHNN